MIQRRHAAAVASAVTVFGTMMWILRRRSKPRCGGAADGHQATTMPLRLVPSEHAFSFGEAVHYPPRMSSLPIVGLPSTSFLLVDDVTAAEGPTTLWERLREASESDDKLNEFVDAYRRECRYLSEAEATGGSVRRLAASANPTSLFTHAITCGGFSAWIGADPSTGFVLTLVCLASPDSPAVAALPNVAALIAWDTTLLAEAAEDLGVVSDGSGSSDGMTGPMRSVPPCCPWAANFLCDAALLKRHVPTVYHRRQVSFAKDCGGSTPPLSSSGGGRYTNASLGVQFVLSPGSRVIPHRAASAADQSELMSVTYLPQADDIDGPRIHLQRATAAPGDLEELRRALLLQLRSGEAGDTGDGPMLRTDIVKTEFAGRPALAYIETEEVEGQNQLWVCKTYVAPPRGVATASALFLRCELPVCVDGSATESNNTESLSRAIAAVLAPFLDTFFLLEQRV